MFQKPLVQILTSARRPISAISILLFQCHTNMSDVTNALWQSCKMRQKVCMFCVTFWSNNSVVRDIGVILGHKVALVMSDILVWHWNNKIEIADIGRRAEVGIRVLAPETPAGLISQSSYHSPKSTLSKASSQSIMLLQNQILSMLRIFCSWQNITGCFYWLLTPLKVPSTKKII